MKYKVLIEESDEGFAVSVPGMPGCHSQGRTENAAIENISDAIKEYRDTVEAMATSSGAEAVTVEV